MEKATGSTEWWCVRGVSERGGARVRLNCDSLSLEQRTSWFQNDWSDWSFPFWQQARFLKVLFGSSLSLLRLEPAFECVKFQVFFLHPHSLVFITTHKRV